MPQWIVAETTRRTITARTVDGARRYELSYESDAPGRGQVSVVGCDADGLVVAELRGEVLSADLPLIARLLAGAAGQDGPGEGAAVPGPRTPHRPPRTGELWSGDEADRLAALHREGNDPTDIAHHLARSENSVRWKLFSLGLAHRPKDLVPAPRPTEPQPPKAYTVEEKRLEHPNAYKRWTAEEDADLLDRCAAGASLAELAEEFGRGEGAIASRLLKLDAQGPAVVEAEEFGG